MELIQLKEEERIDLVAKRIVAYYVQIIEHHRTLGTKNLVIDRVLEDGDIASLVNLADKYDGQSSWREALGMLDPKADWHTLGDNEVSQFRAMGKNGNGEYYINIDRVLMEASVLLSKAGIANYFGKPTSNLKNYFRKTDKKWLVVVL